MHAVSASEGGNSMMVVPFLGKESTLPSVGVKMIGCPREVKASSIFLSRHCVCGSNPQGYSVLGWYPNFRGRLMKEDYITSPWEGKHPAPVLVVQICRVSIEICVQEQLSLLALFVQEPSPDIFWRWSQDSGVSSWNIKLPFLGKESIQPHYWWCR